MVIRITTALLSCFAIAACVGGDVTGMDDSPVELRTDQPSYTLGDEGTLSLTNLHSSTAVEVRHSSPGLCRMFVLQRRVDGEWEHDFGRSICNSDLRYYRLDHGEKVTQPIKILEPLFQPGEEYRYTAAVGDRRADAWSMAVSNIFTVEEE